MPDECGIGRGKDRSRKSQLGSTPRNAGSRSGKPPLERFELALFFARRLSAAIIRLEFQSYGIGASRGGSPPRNAAFTVAEPELMLGDVALRRASPICRDDSSFFASRRCFSRSARRLSSLKDRNVGLDTSNCGDARSISREKDGSNDRRAASLGRELPSRDPKDGSHGIAGGLEERNAPRFRRSPFSRHENVELAIRQPDLMIRNVDLEFDNVDLSREKMDLTRGKETPTKKKRVRLFERPSKIAQRDDVSRKETLRSQKLVSRAKRRGRRRERMRLRSRKGGVAISKVPPTIRKRASRIEKDASDAERSDADHSEGGVARREGSVDHSEGECSDARSSPSTGEKAAQKTERRDSTREKTSRRHSQRDQKISKADRRA